jgi:phosphoribosylformylglycinamidine synthase subunit PurL
MSDVDTVGLAEGTPDVTQPYAELGLAPDEYDKIRELLGRRPTDTELAMYSVMWSEHCSYKSSKVHLRQFADNAPTSDAMLVGMGENAGVVDVGDGMAVTFKVESHNHPSYVEPYQGAATGVGGIVRDILTMGARPIAVMDSLRFGDATSLDSKRVVPGIVAGVGGYGNCLGLPNIGGEVGFDPTYAGNPLVNALCVGVLPHGRIQLAQAKGAGNLVILIGSKTGRDGIGGASVLASATFDDESPTKRPAVQVGDPFAEKVLIECCLELFDAGLVTGIQDLGAAGLSCAFAETAAHGDGGMQVDLEKVPLREASMVPVEILTSESQERMLAIVEPAQAEAVLALCAKWGALATVVGSVTDTGRLVITWHGETVVDVVPGSLADDGPVYHRPIARPDAEQDALNASGTADLARPSSPAELRETVVRMAASTDLCSRRWVTEQYDRYVMGGTVLATPNDAGVLRLSDESTRGIAMALDGNGRFARLDPHDGAQLALAEAYRNVACTGAVPLAITDCLNFGSPEDPAVMWQFAEATRGLAEGCRDLGTPVTGGNVSFYNQTGTTAINPTPVIGVLGVIEDVARRVLSGFAGPGQIVLLLGAATESELDGSAWAWVAHGHLGGRPPKVRMNEERALAAVLARCASESVISSAHDLSDGGLAQALVEATLINGVGAAISLEPDSKATLFDLLFSETTARAIIATDDVGAVTAIVESLATDGVRITVAELGVTGGDRLDIDDVGAIALTELREAFEGTLPALFG